jgi:hypothetical protein
MMKKLLIGLLMLGSVSSFANEFSIINPYENSRYSPASRTLKDHVIFSLNFNYPYSLNFSGSRSYDPLESFSACTPSAHYIIEDESLERLAEPYRNNQGVLISKQYSLRFRVYNENDQNTYDGIDSMGKYRMRGLSMTMSEDENYIYSNSRNCETFEGNIDSDTAYRFNSYRSQEVYKYYSKMWFKDLF